MAANTFTGVKDGNDIWGQQNIALRDILVQDAYTTNGYTLNAADFGLKYFNNILIGSQTGSGRGTYLVIPDLGSGSSGVPITSAKLVLFTALGTQLGNGSTPTAFTVRITAHGR